MDLSIQRNPDDTLAPILLNDFKSQWNEIRVAASAAFERVGKSGWLILGEEVKSFERHLAEAWGLPFAIGCANGLDAIEIALRCLSIKQGDKVLTTPLSAFATTLAVARAGGVPVYVDVDSSGLTDLDQCVEVLEQDRDIKFFVPVHLFGHSLDLRRLSRIKERFEMTIVEDCAQAIGAKSDGAIIGSVGQASATSFYPTKNLGCMGDGGAILTNNPDIATLARSLRDYGQSEKYAHTHMGLNSRLDEVQAAILNDALLPLLKRSTKRRTEIAQAYLREIRNADISIPPAPEGSESVWHLFPVLVKGDRISFQTHLRKSGVSSGIHYPILIPDQVAMRSLDRALVKRELRKARRFAEQEVSLPIHPYLTDSDIERVTSACNSWRQ
jgi:dTDP-4-amino-4,6-dideoxygalactose transaminase